MTGIVHVHRWPVWGHAPSRVDETLEWRAGLTASDAFTGEELDRPGSVVRLNGRALHWVEIAEQELAPGDHLDFGVRPAGVEGALISALISAGVSFGVSLVLSFLLGKPKGPKKRGDNESPTYSWDGKDNTRVEGQPRQAIYGEIEVAPQLIDQYVTTQSVPPRTDLHLLHAFGEGPIHSIGGLLADSPNTNPLSASTPAFPLPSGVKISGNPIENYRAIEAHVRMGTNEQEPIPGFQEVHTVSSVGSTLTQQETDSSSNAGTAWSLASLPYNTNDTAVQAIWTQYAQAFTLPEAADAYTVTVAFPSGLYQIDTNGNLQDAFFQALVRYRELDAGGTPITTGGDNGDGWVYASPTPRLVARHQGTFTHEIGAYLFSSSGFTPGTQGRILQADSAGMYARTASSSGGAAINAVTPWSIAQAIDEFSWVGWFKPVSLGSGSVRPIFEWMATGPARGISIVLQAFTVDVGSIVNQTRWRLVAYWGDGTAVRSVVDSGTTTSTFPTSFPSATWYHIAVTYKRAASGTDGRWRIYINGVLKQERTAPAAQNLLAPAAPFLLGRTVSAGLGTVDGVHRQDEVQVWKKELSAAQVVASYNSGAGTFGVADADLVAGWHFDLQDNVTNFTFANSYANASNKITTVGGGVVGESTTQLDAPVFRSGTGTLKRARYLLQVLRFNLKSTSSATQDQADWESVDGRVSAQLAYPNTPLAALLIPATEQLSTTTPPVTYIVKGRKVPVWDRVSVEHPSFSDQWTANPAWIFFDIVTNRRFGRGGDFDASRVDLVSLAEWADFCDELVYDQIGTAALHSSTSTAPCLNLQYDSALNGGFGGIDLFMRPGFLPPAHWKVGRFIGFRGVAAPPTSGLLVDINVPSILGFQIADVFFNGGTWVVRLLYDKATYGDPWADGATLSTVLNPAAVTGSVEGREERCRFDGVFDTFEKTWDRLLEVCAVGRAMPVLNGSKLRVRISKPRAPVGLVGKGSIEPGSWKVSYPKAKTNVFVADILDRDQGYKRKPVERSDPTLDSDSFESTITRENVELLGIVRRSQANRDLDFRLNVNRLLRVQGEFVTGVEGLLYEAGDVVVLSNDLVPWGTSGRFPQAQSGASVVLEREIVVGATPMWIRARVNRLGQTGSGSSVADYMEVRHVTASAGTYAPGASIAIASAFTAAPAKDDPYVVYTEAEQFLAEITEITLTPDFRRRVRWIEYDEDVFDVDDPPNDIDPLDFSVTAGPLASAQVAPGAVSNLSVHEGQRASAAGHYDTVVTLSWRLDAETYDAVASIVVWARPVGSEQSPWIDVARVIGPARSATFRLPADTAGLSYEYAVQPVSPAGARAAVDVCARVSASVVGTATKPPAPSALRAVMAGDQVTYLWNPPAGARGLSYELRRGSWALGQVIGTAPAGAVSFGPCRDWASSKANAKGDPPPTIFLRSKDQRGVYSEVVRLDGFAPSVAGAELAAGLNTIDQGFEADRCWEDFGAGWLPAGAPAATDPSVSGLVVATSIAGRKVLRFDTGALAGTYVTGEQDLDPMLRPSKCFVEAFAVATQVPPITIDEIGLGLDDPLAASREIEGLVGAAGCTLTIEWRFKTATGAAWGPWQTYRPGVYYFAVPQFRLTITRPDTTWQVEIERFGTRISTIPPERFERNDHSNALYREVFSNA